jgi:hypothetical protein
MIGSFASLRTELPCRSSRRSSVCSSISLRIGAASSKSRSSLTPYGGTPWSPRTPSPAPSVCSANRSTTTAEYRNLLKPCPPPATVSSPESLPQTKSPPLSWQRHRNCPPPQRKLKRIQALNQMDPRLRSSARHRRRRCRPVLLPPQKDPYGKGHSRACRFRQFYRRPGI